MISNSDFRALCQQHSLAATHQRRVIYETVMSLHGHPSPELIYDGVRKNPDDFAGHGLQECPHLPR